jgi:Ser/Thr protein kinase RdoA (MazF antagonist)
MVQATDEVPVVRSVAAPGAIGETVRRRYNLDVVDCVLLRSFVNDVYEVATRDRRYVLKVYQHGGWSAEEVAWELEPVSHLAAAGVAAVMPSLQMEGICQLVTDVGKGSAENDSRT